MLTLDSFPLAHFGPSADDVLAGGSTCFPLVLMPVPQFGPALGVFERRTWDDRWEYLITPSVHDPDGCVWSAVFVVVPDVPVTPSPATAEEVQAAPPVGLPHDVVKLVIAAQGGDKVAFGALVERFSPTVYAVSLARLRDPTEAQDLLQDVFLHAMKKLPQLRDPRCFAGWVRQITVHMAINRLTRSNGRAVAIESDAEIEDDAPEPSEALIRLERSEELAAGMAKLKPIDRATLAAFYLRGRSIKQMSREFDVPDGTIKSRLHVARNRLKEAMIEDGAESACDDA